MKLDISKWQTFVVTTRIGRITLLIKALS